LKLLTKTSRIYLLFSLGIYLATAIAFYWIIKRVIYQEVESRLRVEKRDFEAYIRTHQSWSGSCYFVENKIEVRAVNQAVGQLSQPLAEFKDTLIYNRYEGSHDPFRQLTFYSSIGKGTHRISIRKSLIQSHTLIEVITLTMSVFLGLLLGGMYWFQLRLSGKIWQPFYETLSQLKHFDWRGEQRMALASQPVTEFNELNDVLQMMTDKMQHDYRSLKEFTENASHEIQTPLALINARVEQFIQSRDLSESQTYWIEEIYHASRRMSRLHQGLLLLTRIENHQFTESEEVDLSALFTHKVHDFGDLLSHRQIVVEMEIARPFKQRMSPALADILLANLLNNAIRHNQANGFIRLVSNEYQFCLHNSGEALQVESRQLFERFRKESSHADSLGLGLAIVKQICDNYSLHIEHAYAGGTHSLCLHKDGLGERNYLKKAEPWNK
jgi:signal transduction histidine kinase